MWTGSLDKTGSPTLKLSVAGVAQKFSQEFEAIIDTGFTGFLSMPLTKAIPLGLILYGTTTVILADGQTAFRLTAYVTATVEGQSKGGVVILEWNSSEILIGMDFLRKFEKTLLIHTNRPFVILEDCAKLGALMAATQPPQPPPQPSVQTANQATSASAGTEEVDSTKAESPKADP